MPTVESLSVQPSQPPVATNFADEIADVVVIGGGPAGTTTAHLLARRGWRVTLLEQARHPRFHIGESLLPMNLPILQRLGVLDQVAAQAVYKPGAEFAPHPGEGVLQFHFDAALGRSPDHAYQVDRAQFDATLFHAAAAAGVDCRSGWAVKSVTRVGKQFRVAIKHPQGQRKIAARHVVDASGRSTVLAPMLGGKQKDPRHASAAVYNHFVGGPAMAEPADGNIGVYHLPAGWLWLIPLPGDRLSVGAVCGPEALKARRGNLDQFLAEQIAASPEASQRLGRAKPVGPARAEGNYSYAVRRFAALGVTAVGDAGCFVDPVFSSGVYLAMSGGERAAACVHRSLQAPWLAQLARWRYALAVRRLVGSFSWFIYRFTTPAMRELFANPRNVLGLEQAVIAMLAGNGAGSLGIRARLLAFRAVYALTAWRLSQTRRSNTQPPTLDPVT